MRNNSTNQSGIRLSWIYLHKIAAIYRYLKHKETLWASLEIKKLKSPFFSSLPEKDQPSELNLAGNLQEVPPYLKDIQPFPSQVYNFDDILFDMNGIWCNMVCTYKLFTGERIWRRQTCERAPFWYIALIRTYNNEQCFVPPVLMHQSMHYITT